MALLALHGLNPEGIYQHGTFINLTAAFCVCKEKMPALQLNGRVNKSMEGWTAHPSVYVRDVAKGKTRKKESWQKNKKIG